MALLIGITGLAGSGKSTLAKQYEVEQNEKRIPFAQPLKDMLEAMGVPHKHLHGTPAQKAEPLAILGGKSARFALQRLGTEWGRDMISESLWVDAWRQRAEITLSTGRDVVVDDVRFANEVDVI